MNWAAGPRGRSPQEASLLAEGEAHPEGMRGRSPQLEEAEGRRVERSETKARNDEERSDEE